MEPLSVRFAPGADRTEGAVEVGDAFAHLADEQGAQDAAALDAEVPEEQLLGVDVHRGVQGDGADHRGAQADDQTGIGVQAHRLDDHARGQEATDQGAEVEVPQGDVQVHADTVGGRSVPFAVLLASILALPVPQGAVLDPYGRPPYADRLDAPSPDALLAAAADRKISVEERLTFLELLGWLGRPLDGERVRSLARRVRSAELRAAWVRCLALSLPDPESEEALRRLWKSERHPEVRAEALLALLARGGIEDEVGLRALRSSRSPDPVRVAALRGLAARGSPHGHAEALRTLERGDGGPVLWEALAVLRTEPEPGDVPYLIDLMRRSTGRAAYEAHALLQEITGYRIGPDWRTWRHFWLRHRAEGTPFRREDDAASGELQTLSYLGLPLTSEHVAFLIDASGSMDQPLYAGGATRRERSLEALLDLLPRLPDRARFDVLFFTDTVHAYAPRLVPAEPQGLDSVASWLRRAAYSGGTNVHDALESALALDGVEEVLLLSDGRPSVGELTDPAALAARVARWNRWRRVRISTLAFGAPPDAARFLALLARENDGSFRAW